MTTPWSELSARERDARVAVLIGWVVRIDKHGFWKVRAPDNDREHDMGLAVVFDQRTGEREETAWWEYATHDILPPFTASLDAAQQAVSEVERRGLKAEYVSALVDILGIYGDKSYYDWDRQWGAAVWDVIEASSDQKCEAAVKVLTDA